MRQSPTGGKRSLRGALSTLPLPMSDQIDPVSATTRIASLETFDVRFPTSRELDGSDAMNEDPDYSAAYVVLHTEGAGTPLEGHGFAFTLGRGTEVEIAAI